MKALPSASVLTGLWRLSVGTLATCSLSWFLSLNLDLNLHRGFSLSLTHGCKGFLQWFFRIPGRGALLPNRMAHSKFSAQPAPA